MNNKRWEVQTRFSFGWENCWHVNDRLEPMTFKSKEEATKELEYFFFELDEAFKEGDIAAKYDKHDYRIVEVQT